jgi:hypothetical protein
MIEDTTLREWLEDGRCWACHRANREHTLVELGYCMNAPLALMIVEDEQAK